MQFKFGLPNALNTLNSSSIDTSRELKLHCSTWIVCNKGFPEKSTDVIGFSGTANSYNWLRLEISISVKLFPPPLKIVRFG